MGNANRNNTKLKIIVENSNKVLIFFVRLSQCFFEISKRNDFPFGGRYNRAGAAFLVP